VEICDIVALIGLFGHVLILPFIVSSKASFNEVFISIFGMFFLWGAWRFLYFDQVTNNDIPGFGYIVACFIAGVYGCILFGIRKFVIWIINRRRK